MKNLFVLIVASSLLYSCATTSSPTSYNNTTVSEIYNLKKGMSMQTVNSTLKVLPYEFYTNFQDGNKVLVYRYKKQYQLVSSGNEPNSLNGGKDRYKDESDLYVVFDQKTGEMVYYITDSGRKSAKGILSNSNKLKLIKSDPIEFENALENKTQKSGGGVFGMFGK